MINHLQGLATIKHVYLIINTQNRKIKRANIRYEKYIIIAITYYVLRKNQVTQKINILYYVWCFFS